MEALLVTGIFPAVQEVKHVSMPRFEIDSEGTWSLVTSLIHISSRVIIYSQHGKQTIRRTVSL